ncbi:MAG: hypothetical protein FJ296_06265 [Planctomycetes bacterium]|nr:hypothetical protein [Planctomycetota bacterium]
MGQSRVALTDRAWFDHLATLAAQRAGRPPGSAIVRLDECNFWQPRGPRRPDLRPGAPFFLRLHAPDSCLAGFGFFATWHQLGIAEAWRTFGVANGARTLAEFRSNLERLRGACVDIEAERIGCIVLRDVHFLPPSRWTAWASERDWRPHTQVAKDYDLDLPPGDVLRSLLALQPPDEYAEVAAELGERFTLVEADERRREIAALAVREGQGSFRVRLLQAYGGRCALTGERTLPVLEAAHIQDYLGPRSNHVQNGLVLRADLHDLYDQGYLTVLPRGPSSNQLVIEVSQRIKQNWHNGKLYYALHGRQPEVLPRSPREQPSHEALEWHARNRFVG